MKTSAAMLVCAACLVFANSAAGSADPIRLAQMGIAGGLPPYEILTIIRSTGFDPVGRPIRRGGSYILRALDPYDVEVRLVIDAYSGQVLSARPVGAPPARYAPPGYVPAPLYEPVLPPALPPYGYEPPIVEDETGALPPPPPRFAPSAKPTTPQTRSAAAAPVRAPLPRPRPADSAGPVVATPEQQTSEPGSTPQAIPPVAPLE